MRWCIERLKLKPGSTIFDPFMGSAPVAQAAIELGYRYIGIEKDAKHFDTAVKRIESLSALAA
jgi:DNA modification methylase